MRGRNDIENLLRNEVFFFPASYRRAYQIEETDNANILLRAEVLNKLNNKRNPIIVTYSEALSEKVVSRKELKKHTINLKVGNEIVIDNKRIHSNKSDFSEIEKKIVKILETKVRPAVARDGGDIVFLSF